MPGEDSVDLHARAGTDRERSGADSPAIAAVTDTLAATATEVDLASVPARPLARGEEIGRYVILERRGAGAMGVVYAAYDPELDRRVAIKLLLGAGTESARTRLVREAQAMARLSHPNVIAVHDVGEHAGSPYLAMEFSDGETLRSWLRAAKRTQPEILEAFAAAGAGLAAAHAKGLVHRDFKPDNVMVEADGRVRVMDFGLARADHVVQPDAGSEVADGGKPALALDLTRTGAVMGTPAYMAPEQYVGRETDARTDQFSFCVALYEALYGERPFRGDSYAALAFSVTEGNVRKPAPAAGVPAWLRAVLVRGLVPDPEARWPSMGALLEALADDPSVRRRRRVAWTAGLAGLVGLGLAARLAWPEASTPCEGLATPIDELWTSERRLQLGTRFAATGRGDAAATFERVVGILDAYREKWAGGRLDACEATRVRGEQSEALLDARMSCLDGRLRDFSALLTTYDEVDGDMVERALDAARALPPISSCEQPEYVQAEVQPPDDPTLAAADLRLRESLARVKALEATGRLTHAKDEIEKTRRELADLELPVLAAEVDLAEGAVLEQQGDFDDAQATLRRAFFSARRLDQARIAQESAALLGVVAGLRLAQFDAGREWLEHADADISRAEDPEMAAVASMLTRAQIAYLESRLEDAEHGLEEALATARTLEERVNLVSIASTLCLVQQSQEKWSEAAESCQLAFDAAVARFGEESPNVATAESSLASYWWFAGDQNKGLALQRSAADRIAQGKGEDAIDYAIVLSNLGYMLDEQARTEEALVHVERAIQIIEAKNGPKAPDLIMPLSNLAQIRDTLGDEAGSSAATLRAHELALEVYGLEHLETANTLLNVADDDRTAGRLAEAAEAFEAVDGIYRRLIGPDAESRIVPQAGIALTRLEMADPEAALVASEEAMRLIDLAPYADPDVVAYARFASAQALWATGGDRARARQQADAARALAAADPRLGELVEEIDAWRRRHR